VSAKREIRNGLLTLIVFSTIWVILVLLEVTGFLFAFIWILPIWSIGYLLHVFLLLRVADINIDETNGELSIITLFNKKKILLKDIKVMSHEIYKEIFLHINNEQFRIEPTRKNYNEIIKLFELINYPYAHYFEEKIQKIIY